MNTKGVQQKTMIFCCCTLIFCSIGSYSINRTASWRIREASRILLEQEVINVARYNEKIAPSGVHLGGLIAHGGTMDLYRDVDTLHALFYGRREFAGDIVMSVASAAALCMLGLALLGRKRGPVS